MTRRTAISLPDKLYSRIERSRGRRGLDRSAWVAEAASEYLARREHQADVEAYYESYRQIPEDAGETRDWERASIEALKDLD